MQLVEEYLLRHAIQLPLVKHQNAAVVFFRDKDGVWCVKQLQWHPPDVHPGMYSASTNRVSHNGFEKGRYFDHIEESQLQWDEYEPYLLEWASVPRIVPRTQGEMIIAEWEMVLRCCDKALIRHVNHDKLCASIDSDLPIDERCQIIEECVEYFSRSAHDVYRMWSGDLAFYRSHYALWLAEMVPICKG